MQEQGVSEEHVLFGKSLSPNFNYILGLAESLSIAC